MLAFLPTWLSVAKSQDPSLGILSFYAVIYPHIVWNEGEMAKALAWLFHYDLSHKFLPDLCPLLKQNLCTPFPLGRLPGRWKSSPRGLFSSFPNHPSRQSRDENGSSRTRELGVYSCFPTLYSSLSWRPSSILEFIFDLYDFVLPKNGVRGWKHFSSLLKLE